MFRNLLKVSATKDSCNEGETGPKKAKTLSTCCKVSLRQSAESTVPKVGRYNGAEL